MFEIEFRESSLRVIVDMPAVPRVDEFVNVCNSSGQRISGRVQQVQYMVDFVGDPCEILVLLVKEKVNAVNKALGEATARFVDDRDAPAGFDRHLLRVEAASAREARQKYYEAKRAIMKTKINLSDFVDGGRKVVLGALDKHVRETVDHVNARGWVDAELPKLFLSVDAHLESVAMRIYNGEEPGSAIVSIDMDS